MLEEQQARYFHINKERADAILHDYQSFKLDYDEFRFAEDAPHPSASPSDGKTTNALYQELARGMSQVAGLGSQPIGLAGLGKKGIVKVLVKKLGARFLRPFIREAFAQQLELNRHAVMLAQAVVALEARLTVLEHRIASPGHTR